MRHSVNSDRPGGGDRASGVAVREQDFLRAEGGELELLVRAYEDLTSLRAVAGGQGFLRAADGQPVRLNATGVEVELPLLLLRKLTGRGGAEERFYRARISVQADAEIVLRFKR